MIKVYRQIKTAYTCRDVGGQGDIHHLDHAAIVTDGESIKWIGRESEIPSNLVGGETIECGGALAVPGLVDCHTHLCFGGWRADEFEARILGKSYQEIAAAGGGILSTVEKTRSASLADLFQRGLGFLREMMKLGVTTVECKSGYGLSLDCELKILRAYRELSRIQPLRLVSTFLGAHTVPAEFKSDPEQYVRQIIDSMIPAVAAEKLAQFCDVFVEPGAFTAKQGREILEAGKRSGLLPKIHGEQFSRSGGAELAAQVGAVSIDHLEMLDPAGLEAIKSSGAVAVLLPLSSLHTKVSPADGRRIVSAGVPVAVATDFNPGTSPSYHLPQALSLACLLNRLTPAEALKGATIYAARALGLNEQVGSLEAGKSADFALIRADTVGHWLQNPVPNFCERTVCRGVDIYCA